MSSYRLTDKAQGDLDEIGLYTLEEWGLEQALQYVDGLERACALLAENPNLGPLADQIEPGLRCHVHGSHVIFYEPSDPGILVLRILHASMDAPRPLGPSFFTAISVMPSHHHDGMPSRLHDG